MDNKNGRDPQQSRSNNNGNKKPGGYKQGKKRPYYNKKRNHNHEKERDTGIDVRHELVDSPETDGLMDGVSEAELRKENINVSDLNDDTDSSELIYGSDVPRVSVAIETEDTKKVRVAGIRFKSTGKIYYFDPGDIKLTDGSYVIVDTARGMEYGEVAFSDREVPESTLVLPLRRVIRMATCEDARRNEENKAKEKEAFDICLSKIESHGLDMKLVDVQYTFDNSKLLFYFTSAGRVDFRELVKDLAGVFKTRIELRQIGIRDEAKLLGGLGACGRPLCCSTFLSDFVQVSIKMAKEQNLSLNSSKISGCCGRLMCCLQYEYQTYAEETAKTPPVDSTVKTVDGVGTVTETNPLAGTVKVRLKDQPEVIPKSYRRDDVKVLSKPRGGEEKNEKNEKNGSS